MATIEPIWSYDARQKGYFWMLLHEEKTGNIVFASFKNAKDMLSWYEDASISYGEEGRCFSNYVVAMSHNTSELTRESEIEED